jgi:signal peptidase I
MSRLHDVLDLNKVLLVGVLPFLLVANLVPDVCAWQITYDCTYEVISSSMLPTLELLDSAYVRNVTMHTEIHASQVDGDIIVFHMPGNPASIIIHRAIEELQEDSKWYFRTKGDNNVSPDFWNVSESDLIGKVVALSRVLFINSYNVTVFSNALFSDFHLNSSANSLDFSVDRFLTQTATNSFLNASIPNELVTGSINVIVNGSSVSFGQSTNSTYYFVWFDQTGTGYKSNIILPEFSSLMIPPLFMIVTLLAVIVYKRRTVQSHNT